MASRGGTSSALRRRAQGRADRDGGPGGLIAKALDPACVVGSVVYPAAVLTAPNVVKVVEGNRFTLGEPDGTKSARVEAIAAQLVAAGFKAPVIEDIRAEIWLKLWGNASFNPIRRSRMRRWRASVASRIQGNLRMTS